MNPSASRASARESGVGIPPQVVRLALTFIGLTGLFFLFRGQTMPASFGSDGHYRDDAPKQIAASPLKHAERKACADCHSDIMEVSLHYKKGVACESCHGPALAHVEDYEKFKPLVSKDRALCARCHASVPGRRISFPQVNVREHNPGSSCVDCHKVHGAPSP